MGDESGLEDLREALRRGLDLGLGDEVATTYNNLAYELWFWDGPAAALEVWEQMLAFCRVRGFASGEMWAESGRLESLFDVGRWDEADEIAAELRAWGRAHGYRRVSLIATIYLGWLRLRRGDLVEAARHVEDVLPAAREIGYGEFLAPGLMIAAEVALATGDPGAAIGYVREFAGSADSNPEYFRLFLPVAARVLVGAGAVDEASRLVQGTGRRASRRLYLSLRTSGAVVDEARGDTGAAAEAYAEVADRWGAYGFVLEEARSRVGLARCYRALGREADSIAELDRARELLAPLGARPMLAEVDRLRSRTAATAG
jgi:tetratricopeptide (TPR) repeat protein